MSTRWIQQSYRCWQRQRTTDKEIVFGSNQLLAFKFILLITFGVIGTHHTNSCKRFTRYAIQFIGQSLNQKRCLGNHNQRKSMREWQYCHSDKQAGSRFHFYQRLCIAQMAMMSPCVITCLTPLVSTICNRGNIICHYGSKG